MRRFVLALRLLLLCLLSGLLSLSYANPHPSWGVAPWSKAYVEKIEKTYGEAVGKRARRLETIILSYAGRSDEDKLDAVNRFFNEVEYVSDLAHWGKVNYWQTPLETLVEFKGDCEDIAIAKYATLRAMGVPDEKLALVNARVNGQSHMMLAFFASAHAEPLLLDNLTSRVMKASARTGITPIYGFNTSSLWLLNRQMRKFGKTLPVPASHKLSLS